MTMMKLATCLALLTSVAGLAAAGPCPAPVTAAVAKAYPKSTVTSCVAEKAQFEVKLVRAGGAKLELDVAPDGAILLTEEVIAVDQLPAVVAKAFAAKYPKARPTRAERQTPAKGHVTFELAFAGDKGAREATFDDTGAFVGEE